MMSNFTTEGLVGLGKLLLRSLLEPRAKDEDARRREFIFNILLSGTILLAVAATIIVAFETLTLGSQYEGMRLSSASIILLILFAVYLLPRLGFLLFASLLLIGFYATAATYVVYTWGIDLHIGLLVYALVLVIAGILFGTRFLVLVFVGVGLAFLLVSYSQLEGLHIPNSSWRLDDNVDWADAIIFLVAFAIIFSVSWLSNREIEKSLHRARRSEAALRKERDNLELTVEKRTRELKRAQLEKMLHLYRLADFGRVASGLFHDLINPLNVVSLNLEDMQDEHKNKKGKINPKRLRASIDEAMTGTRRMERFVEAARRHVRQKRVRKEFSLVDEIQQVLPILDYKAKTQQVKIHLDAPDDIQLYGDPIKFNQIVTNLITNAIESYEGLVKRSQRRVEIRLRRAKHVAALAIKDWGCGIEPDKFGEIFQPFYTTKDFEKGMGVGLRMVKDNVEQEFGGSITVDSHPGEGTIFTIMLPLKRDAKKPA